MGLPLEKLNVQASMLQDEGLAEFLPYMAGPAFSNIKALNLVATKLTVASEHALTLFLSEQFPTNRRLSIDLRLIQYPRLGKGSKQASRSDEFAKALKQASKARPTSNFIL